MSELNEYSGPSKPDLTFDDFPKDFLLKLMTVCQYAWIRMSESWYTAVSERFGADAANDCNMQAWVKVAEWVNPRYPKVANFQLNTVLDSLKCLQLPLDNNIGPLYPVEYDIKTPNHVIMRKPKDPDEHYDRREKEADERFCHSCGAVVKKSSAICPKCGVSITGHYERKDKSTAILLALFTSFFSWLYLYEKNTVKFWLGLGVTVAGAIIATRLFDSSNQYWCCGIIPAAIVWIFAVVDVSTKGASYYESFGG